VTIVLIQFSAVLPYEEALIMSTTPLFDNLKKYNAMAKGYFRIPGHRFERGAAEDFVDFCGKGVFKIDVTETPLTDDLHNPAGAIRESQALTAEAFGADSSFYLVNGTSCGNQSMILAAVREGEKIIVPRNAHKSVMSGLVMTGAVPVYAGIDEIGRTGIQDGLSVPLVRRLLQNNTGCKAIFAVSPTYHGICSDTGALAAAAHEAGIPLLVDEAHGTHFYFNDRLPQGAMGQGADACAQSIHKTCGALTQSSLLHIRNGLIDCARLDNALRMTMSTSPSYVLMASIETARAQLEQHGGELLDYALGLASEIKDQVNGIPGLYTPDLSSVVHDPLRVIVNCGKLRISGYDLKRELYDKWRIDSEMAGLNELLFIVNWGNTKDESRLLISALKELALRYAGEKHGKNKKTGSDIIELPPIPRMKLTPRQAWLARSRKIPWAECAGQVSAEAIIPYPPGIPVVNPGEVITEEIFEYVKMLKTEKIRFHGPADKTLSSIGVCSL
jgi:arginine/lysine/ornithine decarboxylase